MEADDLLAAAEAALIGRWQRAQAEGRVDDARRQVDFLLGVNGSLVRRFTARYRLTRLGRDDLAQAGHLGLLSALERFVPDRGRFPAYASFWIRKEVQRALGAGEFSLSVPAHLPGRLVALRSLSADGAAPGLGLSASTVRSLRAVLDDPRRQGPPDSGDVPDPGPATDEEAVGRLMGERLSKAVATLPDHLQQVVCLLYGLDGTEPVSARGAAPILGVSEFTVRSRLKEAMRRLRRALGPG
jgi:RNA polymerase sigma factor (sigma-70 family)